MGICICMVISAFSCYIQAESLCSYSSFSGSSKPTFSCQRKQGLKGNLCVDGGFLAHSPPCLLVDAYFSPLNFSFHRCKVDILLYLPHRIVVSIKWKECSGGRGDDALHSISCSHWSVRKSWSSLTQSRAERVPSPDGQGGVARLSWWTKATGKEAPTSRTSLSSMGKYVLPIQSS